MLAIWQSIVLGLVEGITEYLPVSSTGHLEITADLLKIKTPATAAAMAEKIVHLRIFNDENDKMNRSLIDTCGSILAVSQFTLYGDARGQRRPSFIAAAPPEKGKALYEEFVAALKALGVKVQTGVFQAHMSVELTNDGPVTLLLDSDKTF